MADEDQGLPLEEAFRAYGDPELLAAYERACDRVRSIPPCPDWFIDPAGHMAWRDEYEEALRTAEEAKIKAWKARVADFKRRLWRGELVATGFKLGSNEQSTPIVIPARQWSGLVFDFRHSSAKHRDGREFFDIRVRPRPLETRAGRGSAGPAAKSEEEPQTGPPEAGAALASADTDATRRKKGQPSHMKAIKAELERRAEEGRLCESQAEEFRALEAWAREEQVHGRLPKHKIPKVRSIEKSLAETYQELKAKKSMR